MRIAVWNVNHWQRGAEQRARVWRVLREELNADVAMLQEVGPIDEPSTSVVYREIGATRPWGTAVAGLTVPLSPVDEARVRTDLMPCH